VIDSNPDIQTWTIGGHSLGGSMAARFARLHPEEIKGLVLWASYPAETDDLSGSTLPVLSISASRDGLATRQRLRQHEVCCRKPQCMCPSKVETMLSSAPTGLNWEIMQR